MNAASHSILFNARAGRSLDKSSNHQLPARHIGPLLHVKLSPGNTSLLPWDTRTHDGPDVQSRAWGYSSVQPLTDCLAFGMCNSADRCVEVSRCPTFQLKTAIHRYGSYIRLAHGLKIMRDLRQLPRVSASTVKSSRQSLWKDSTVQTQLPS